MSFVPFAREKQKSSASIEESFRGEILAEKLNKLCEPICVKIVLLWPIWKWKTQLL